MLRVGDLVVPRNDPEVPLDLVGHDEVWISFNQGEVGVVLEVYPHSHDLTWVVVFAPGGVGDCYAHDLRVL